MVSDRQGAKGNGLVGGRIGRRGEPSRRERPRAGDGDVLVGRQRCACAVVGRVIPEQLIRPTRQHDLRARTRRPRGPDRELAAIHISRSGERIRATQNQGAIAALGHRARGVGDRRRDRENIGRGVGPNDQLTVETSGNSGTADGRRAPSDFQQGADIRARPCGSTFHNRQQAGQVQRAVAIDRQRLNRLRRLRGHRPRHLHVRVGEKGLRDDLNRPRIAVVIQFPQHPSRGVESKRRLPPLGLREISGQDAAGRGARRKLHRGIAGQACAISVDFKQPRRTHQPRRQRGKREVHIVRLRPLDMHHSIATGGGERTEAVGRRPERADIIEAKGAAALERHAGGRRERGGGGVHLQCPAADGQRSRRRIRPRVVQRERAAIAVEREAVARERSADRGVHHAAAAGILEGDGRVRPEVELAAREDVVRGVEDEIPDGDRHPEVHRARSTAREDGGVEARVIPDRVGRPSTPPVCGGRIPSASTSEAGARGGIIQRQRIAIPKKSRAPCRAEHGRADDDGGGKAGEGDTQWSGLQFAGSAHRWWVGMGN